MAEYPLLLDRREIGIERKAIAKDIQNYYFVEHGTKLVDGHQQKIGEYTVPKNSFYKVIKLGE